jgi:hypothetical protein
MLRHIVMVRFKDRERVEHLAFDFKDRLMALEDAIPELLKMEVGVNVNTTPSAYDLVLVSDFEDEMALEIYRIHPEHLKVVEFMKSVTSDRAVVDYYL